MGKFLEKKIFRWSLSYNQGAHFLHWNQNSKFWVTWPRIAQSVYFLREMCLFFNFWMIKFTIMCFFDIHSWNFSSKVLYMSKNHNSFKKYTNWAKLSHFWGKCFFWHVEDLRWEISCMNVKKNIVVIFIIQKLKIKHISLKKYTDWAILGYVTQNLEFWFQRKCAPKVV